MKCDVIQMKQRYARVHYSRAYLTFGVIMIELLEKEAESIVARSMNAAGRGEEATKQALVLPWLNALGYDIWNPSEVCPEFESDTAVKKAGQKEKVDLAIILNGQPVVFIEVKPLGEPLSGHHGQLKRYFNSTTSVVLGVLTNGLEYRFFTDSAESNIMDDEPFYISKLDTSERGLDVVIRFSKKVFSAEAIRDYATELKFTARIEKFLTEQLDIRERMPSESFVRWVLGEGIYDGRITANVVDRFAPITKEALQRVQMRQVRRSIARMEEGVSSGGSCCEQEESELLLSMVGNNAEDENIERKGINTTDEEMEAFALIRKIAMDAGITTGQIYDPGRRKDDSIEIGYRDTTGYFSIYLNKTSWWCVRLNFDAKQKWIGFPYECTAALKSEGLVILPQSNIATVRVQIDGPADLLKLKDLIVASMQRLIEEKNEFKVSLA